MDNLAQLTGGRSLKDNPSQVFTHNLSAQAPTTPLWPGLMLAALILLPVDIAVRRLIITRSDLQRFQRWAFGRQTVEGTSERLITLMDAKQRGRQRAEEIGAASGTVSVLNAQRKQTQASSTAEEQPASPPSSGDKPATFMPAQKPSPEQGNVAGELLKKRKERQK